METHGCGDAPPSPGSCAAASRPACPTWRRSARVIQARFQGELVAAKVFDLSRSRELQVGRCTRAAAAAQVSGGRAKA